MGFRKWMIDKFAGEIIESRLKEEVAKLASDIVNKKQYERLSKRGPGDLPKIQHSKHLALAHYLYLSNPLARRMMEYQKVYVIGDGIIWKAPDDETRKVIQKHWDDPVNRWQIKQNQRALELGLWGEQIYPVFVNKETGHVKLGVINPMSVENVLTDPENAEIKIAVEATIKDGAYGTKKKKYFIIQDPKSTEPLDTDGEENYCFYYSVNGLSNTNRGFSDLLSLEDWIDAYDKIVFDFVERSSFLQSFLWDITMEGAGKEILDKKRNELETEPPNAGSFLVHDQNETWKALTPDLRSRENIEEARHIRNIVLAGMGYPEYWFAEGEKTTRATALAQGAPTLKVLEERQAVIKNIVRDVLTFQAYQAQARGMIKKETSIEVFVDMPELAVQEYDKVFGALVKLVQALALAVERKLMTHKLSIIVLDRYLFRAGFEFSSDDQIKELTEMVAKNDYERLGETMRKFDKLKKYRKEGKKKGTA